MTEILLGFMTAAWLFTGLGGAYAFWRYCYQPWKVMRSDLRTLVDREDAHYRELREDVGLRKAMNIDDMQANRFEAREAMRTALRGING